MSTIRIMTNFNIELEFPAASFLRRLAAWLIDIVILYIYARIGVEVIDQLTGKVSEQLMWIIFLIFLVPFLTYHLITEFTMNGQSFGKKIMSIRVVNENGGQPNIGQYVIRWLIRYVATHDFRWFAWYRIAFGIVVLLTAYLGWVEWRAD